MVNDITKILKKVEKLEKQNKKEKKESFYSKLKKKLISKPLIKKSNVELQIEEKEQAEYKPIYFKSEWEETKKSLFMK